MVFASSKVEAGAMQIAIAPASLPEILADLHGLGVRLFDSLERLVLRAQLDLGHDQPGVVAEELVDLPGVPPGGHAPADLLDLRPFTEGVEEGLGVGERAPSDQTPEALYERADTQLYAANIGLIGMVATSPERPSTGFTLFALLSVISAALFVVNLGKPGTIGRLAAGGAASEKFTELPDGSVGNAIRFARDGTMFVADYKKHKDALDLTLKRALARQKN